MCSFRVQCAQADAARSGDLPRLPCLCPVPGMGLAGGGAGARKTCLANTKLRGVRARGDFGTGIPKLTLSFHRQEVT